MTALERRAAEAVILRLWANGLPEGADAFPLLILGDLNDVPAAQISPILNGPPGSQIGTQGFDPTTVTRPVSSTCRP